MNVNDFKGEESQNKLQDIFDKQSSLMKKYETIERDNSLLETDDIPVDLDDRFGQARLKNFAWRVTEELMEGLEAYHKHDSVHFKEELADALHFLTEMTILSGHQHPGVSLEGMFIEAYGAIEVILEHETGNVSGVDLTKLFTLDVVYNLGLACNCLKNKPWKQTHMITDKLKYAGFIDQAWASFIRLCAFVGFTPESLYDMYFRKNKVNQFRQNSNY
jgi:hypothetical protein